MSERLFLTILFAIVFWLALATLIYHQWDHIHAFATALHLADLSRHALLSPTLADAINGY
jgi:hypothetical protein